MRNSAKSASPRIEWKSISSRIQSVFPHSLSLLVRLAQCNHRESPTRTFACGSTRSHWLDVCGGSRWRHDLERITGTSNGRYQRGDTLFDAGERQIALDIIRNRGLDEGSPGETRHP